MEIKGISETSATLLKLVPAFSQEYILSKNMYTVLDNHEAVCEFFRSQFAGEINEKIKVACLDDRLRLICCDELSEGTISSVKLDIKTLVKYIYKNNSESIIIAHNHPNGELLPSDEDIRMTTEIYKKLKPIGIELIDHIIVAKGQAISLKDIGAFALLNI